MILDENYTSSLVKNDKKCALSIPFKLKITKIILVFNRNWIVMHYYHVRSTLDMIITHLFITIDDEKFCTLCTLHTQKQQNNYDFQ